jgi:hypothetical protein
MRITYASLFSHEPLFVLPLKRKLARSKLGPTFIKIHYLSSRHRLRWSFCLIKEECEVLLKNYPKQPRKSATLDDKVRFSSPKEGS